MGSPEYNPKLPQVPTWLNAGDNAWQLTAATLVGIMSMPGLVILYGSIVKKKWAINSAFMALYAFASTYIVWLLLAYNMAFGEKLFPFWGKARPVLGSSVVSRARFTAAVRRTSDGKIESPMTQPFFPMATLVQFEFMDAALAVILLGGSVLGRMNIKAWMMFVPLWIIFCYTVGAFTLWGGGFLYQWRVLDFSGGYVVHTSSGIAGFVAAYWVDDALAVFHTHAVAGILGGLLTGILADPSLCAMVVEVKEARGVAYGGGAIQLLKQLVATLFVVTWNVVLTSAVLLLVKCFTPLRMSDEQLLIGDDAAHGEEAYALWGDGEKYDATRAETVHPLEVLQRAMLTAARGATVQI